MAWHLIIRIITLIPLSKRAKQIIKQHGDRWLVLEKRDRILFDERDGPWLLVIPITEDQAPAMNAREARNESQSRWVHEHYDFEFKTAP